MSELTVLQAVRLKGRVSPTEVAATLGEDQADVTATVDRLIAAGLLVEATTLRISSTGRARLSELLDEERNGAETTALAAAYDEFRAVNADFKALVTDWQLKGGPDGEPNTHNDADYDAAVLARLDEVHARVAPILDAAATQLPRLKAYPSKLLVALRKIKVGETEWLTAPLIDSYHTVWFELHEELILAAGLTREEAARSGDAQ
jgi:DNA-binding MarR family transcriptional regulator